MKRLLDYRFLAPIVLLVGFAPFYPEPHLVEKLRMLLAGTLNKPIDILDFCWHLSPFVLLVFRIAQDIEKL